LNNDDFANLASTQFPAKTGPPHLERDKLQLSAKQVDTLSFQISKSNRLADPEIDLGRAGCSRVRGALVARDPRGAFRGHSEGHLILNQNLSSNEVYYTVCF
jgi:hypothetical protein